MDNIPSDLLPAFCGTPRDVLTLSAVCTRFNNYFRGAAPVFTLSCAECDTIGVISCTIESSWYRWNSELIYDSGPALVHRESPKYLLATEFAGFLWHFNTLPWFYPLAPQSRQDGPRRWWFKLIWKSEQDLDVLIDFEKYYGSEIDGLVTHYGDGLWIVPINIAAAGNNTKYARALYKKMEVAWS